MMLNARDQSPILHMIVQQWNFVDEKLENVHLTAQLQHVTNDAAVVDGREKDIRVDGYCLMKVRQPKSLSGRQWVVQRPTVQDQLRVRTTMN